MNNGSAGEDGKDQEADFRGASYHLGHSECRYHRDESVDTQNKVEDRLHRIILEQEERRTSSKAAKGYERKARDRTSYYSGTSRVLKLSEANQK